MIRYVPPFILYNLERGKLHGSFPGFILHFYLTNFTPICDVLQKEGKRGAEEISRLLAAALQEPLAQVEQNGGYIIGCAGNSFMAVFRESAARNVLAASVAIRNHFLQLTQYVSPLGTFPLKSRLLVSFGKISWRIFENELQNEYVFRGRVISEQNRLAKNQTGLIYTEEAVLKTGGIHFAKLWRKEDYIHADQEPPASIQTDIHVERMAERFLQSRFRDLRPENEIRPAVCCMANLEKIKFEHRPEAISVLQQLALKYGGFVNKLKYDEKGIQALILFGMPRNEGDIHIKACFFAHEALQAEPLLAFGLAGGDVFAGFTGSDRTYEYTALGHPVNLSARLLALAKPGEIICSYSILKEAGKTFGFEHHATTRLRGISSPVKSYKLIKVQAGNDKPDPVKFIGRDSEKAWLRKKIRETFAEEKNRVIYIKGEAGIGKTRLLHEALSSFHSSKYYVITMKCELSLPKPLRADIRFMRSFYGLKEENLNPKGYPIFHKKWTAWAGDDPKLKDLEPMLAAYLNLWSVSKIKKEYPQWLLPERQLAGWVTFLQELAARRHLILVIDDVQRIDPMSQEYLMQIAKAGISPLCVVVGYTPENQETIDLNLPDYSVHELELQPLSGDSSLELYRLLLGVEQFTPATKTVILHGTRGNPAHIMHVCSGILQANLVTPNGDINLDKEVDSYAVVTDVLRQYFDLLDEKTKECVSTASVLGMRFNSRVLAAMLEADPTKELLAGVSAHIWLDEGEGNYAFVHATHHDVAYRRMLSDKLAQLHLKAALALEEFYREDREKFDSDIGQHYQKADEMIQDASQENSPFNLMQSENSTD